MAGKHELEKFEYLFVDIEWNQTPGTNGIEDREPIQIGVVATDESMCLQVAAELQAMEHHFILHIS